MRARVPAFGRIGSGFGVQSSSFSLLFLCDPYVSASPRLCVKNSLNFFQDDTDCYKRYRCYSRYKCYKCFFETRGPLLETKHPNANNVWMLIVLTTVSDEQQAEKLARAVVEKRLAACVQILPRLISVYVWEGKIERENEHLLLIKTLSEKYDELEAFFKANHSYETPEIVAIPAEHVEQNYASWLENYLR